MKANASKFHPAMLAALLFFCLLLPCAIAENPDGFHSFLDMPPDVTPEEFQRITKEKVDMDTEVIRFKKQKDIVYVETRPPEAMPYLRAEFRIPKYAKKGTLPPLRSVSINYSIGQAISYFDDSPAGWSERSISEYATLFRQLSEEYGAPTQHYFLINGHGTPRKPVRFHVPGPPDVVDAPALMKLCESTISIAILARWGNVTLELVSNDMPNRGREGHLRAQRLHIYYQDSISEIYPLETYPSMP